MNFKKNVIPSPIKKPSFTGYGDDYMVQAPRKSVSLLTLFLVILCTFVLAFVLFKNYDRITNMFSSSLSNTGLQIGQIVSLSGELQSNGDLISYTHTLSLSDATIVGLKSRTLDLSVYTGNVDIQGTVEKELNNIFIVEVSSVSGSLASTGTVADQSLLGSGSGIYIPQAGIYLPAEFGTKYTILSQGENGVLKVQNIATNQIILISYFACKKSDPNKNCSQLQQNIGASAEKTLSTPYGDKLYKLEGITSWFFTNGNYYGYFINDIPEQEVIDVTNALILPNDSYVHDTLLSKLQTLCTDGNTSLIQVTTSSLGVDLNGLIMNLQGPTANGSATCKVFIDPSQAAGGTKLSYVSSTPNTSTGTTETTATLPSTPTTSSPSTIDTSVTQFPINLEKTMTYTGKGGYSVIFPSRNIAFESVNTDEDLGLPGVRCSSQINVTKFADQDTLSDNPKVRVFTCTIKGTLSNIGNSIIQKTSANGIQFLIQIMDPSWADFATNIAIQ